MPVYLTTADSLLTSSLFRSSFVLCLSFDITGVTGAEPGRTGASLSQSQLHVLKLADCTQVRGLNYTQATPNAQREEEPVGRRVYATSVNTGKNVQGTDPVWPQ